MVGVRESNNISKRSRDIWETAAVVNMGGHFNILVAPRLSQGTKETSRGASNRFLLARYWFKL